MNSEYLLARHWQGVAGAIVTSPWLELASPLSPARLRLVSMAARLVPRLVVHNGLHASDLGRSPSVSLDYRKDDLVHPWVSLGVVSSAARAGSRWCSTHPPQACVPLLVAHGDADRVTRFGATRRYAERAGPLVTWRPWAGGFHELHHDEVAAPFFDALYAWLVQLVGSGGK